MSVRNPLKQMSILMPPTTNAMQFPVFQTGKKPSFHKDGRSPAALSLLLCSNTLSRRIKSSLSFPVLCATRRQRLWHWVPILNVITPAYGLLLTLMRQSFSQPHKAVPPAKRLFQVLSDVCLPSQSHLKRLDLAASSAFCFLSSHLIHMCIMFS